LPEGVVSSDSLLDFLLKLERITEIEGLAGKFDENPRLFEARVVLRVIPADRRRSVGGHANNAGRRRAAGGEPRELIAVVGSKVKHHLLLW
jgi:hypothetical protein